MIRFDGVSVSFGVTSVFENYTEEFACGRINCILGPSGSGKTTLLNVIAESVTPSSGKVDFDGCKGHNVSYVFQEHRLIPEKTVFANLDFALFAAFPDKAERAGKVEDYLKMVGLADSAKKYPKHLSGGMAQRVSLARAFAYPSDIILMDEPFRGLDKRIKDSIIESFLSLWEEDGRTAFFVTHDVDEALLLADCIYIFSDKPISGSVKFEIKKPHRGRKLYDADIVALKTDIYKIIE